MGARIAGQIEELLGREVGGWDPLEDLLVGRIGRPRCAPVLAISGLIVAPSMMSSAWSEPPRL
jgi:hypothetical protein